MPCGARPTCSARARLQVLTGEQAAFSCVLPLGLDAGNIFTRERGCAMLLLKQPLHRMARNTGFCCAADHKQRCVACRCPSWWTVDAPMVQSEPALSPLMLRAMHILLTLLQLRLPAAWKSMQLSVVMLWNAAVQSGDQSPW